MISLEEAAAVLRSGGIGAFPTETVFGLGGHPFCPRALQRIFQVKGRPGRMPLSLHLGNLGELFKFSQDLPAEAGPLIEAFWPGPLALVLPASPLVPLEARSSKNTASFRYPQSEVFQRLAAFVGAPLAATSANRSGSLSPLSIIDVLAEIGSEIDFILPSQNESTTHCNSPDSSQMSLQLESTILDLTVHPFCLLREGAISRTELEEKTKYEFQPEAANTRVRPFRLVLLEGDEQDIAHFWVDRPSGEDGAVLICRPAFVGGTQPANWIPMVEGERALFALLGDLHRQGIAQIYLQDIWDECSLVRRRLLLRAERILPLQKGARTCI